MSNNNNKNITEARKLILAHALIKIDSRGWTKKLLKEAIIDSGTNLPLAERAFPRGIQDLLVVFNDHFDSEMALHLEQEDLNSPGYTDRVKRAIILRFQIMSPYRKAVRQAIAFYALPDNAFDGARCLARTADAVWLALEDTSVDFSYYTKRATLATVIGATALVWADDEQNIAWPEFLNRRIENILSIGKLRSKAKDVSTSIEKSLKAKSRQVFPSGLPCLHEIWPVFPR